jgi:ketosteroid isomerase-like protein
MIMASQLMRDHGALTAELYRCFGHNDYEGVLAYVAPECGVLLMPFGQTFRGPAGFNEFMHGFKTAWPDCTIEIRNQVVAGDQVVNEIQVRGMLTGPLAGPASTIPPTGRPVDYRACEVWQMRDGQVVSLRNYQDTATVLRRWGCWAAARACSRVAWAVAGSSRSRASAPRHIKPLAYQMRCCSSGARASPACVTAKARA